MRIGRLDITGFGPYRSRQRIDFTRFDADGLFLITGKTGSGKSTILDAVCFALYGAVPRFDNRELQVRSQYSSGDEITEVELEFELDGTSYRVRRRPRYGRLGRGGRMVQADPDAELSVLDGDTWRGIAVGPRDVGFALSAALPIKQDQFLQVVLLAQNRFQQFLLAKTPERREVLQALFGTKRFADLEADLAERRRTLGAAGARVREAVTARARLVAEQSGAEAPDAADAAWFTDARARFEAAHRDALAAATASRAEHAAAAAAAEASRVVHELQRRRSEATASLAAVAQAAAEIASLGTALELAERAARIRPAIAQHRSAQQGYAAATAAQTLAERAVEHATGTTAPADAAAVVSALLERRGALQQALDDEQRLPALRRQVDGIAAEQQALDERNGALAARRAALPKQIAELDARIVVATATAATAESRGQALARLRTALADTDLAARLTERLQQARVAEKAASTAALGARHALDRLLTQRLAGQTFALAAELVDGEPCAVCGSTVHPHPAATDAEPVTQADIDAARAMLDRADTEASRTAETAAAADRAAAEVRGRAGDTPRAELLQQVAEAETQLAAALAAERDRSTLERSRGGTVDELADVDRATTVAVGEATELAARAAAAAAAARNAAERTQAERGDFASVADRASALDREIAALQVFVDRSTAAAESARRVDSAAAALDTALGESSFADVAAAEAAQLSAAAVAAHTERIRRSDDAEAVARATLQDPAVAAAPIDAVDPTPALAALAEATSRRDAAVAAESAAATTLGVVAAAARDALADLAASERAAAEFEQVKQLANVVAGLEPNTRRIRLETYVLAARLEEIIQAANGRLATMSNGRYALRLDDEKQRMNAETGLGIAVLDAYSGRTRQAASLSGGEQFLASLSLALGLAEVVSAQAGGIALDTLFVDEGFGSLDGDSLEVAMGALDSLRAGGRTIGLISHVESMKERIPAKLEIRVLESGQSEVVTQP